MRRIAILFCAPVWTTACVDRDVLNHHVDSGAGVAEPVPRQGNFPEPAVSVCGPLPDHIDPIPGMVTAWGAAGPTPGLSSEGEPYPPDAIRLRFSDIGYDCDEAFFAPEGAEGDPSVTGWAFAISLQPELQQPGVHVLDDAPGLFPEVMMWDANLGGEVGGEGGYQPPSGSSGELEIFAITNTCIIGQLRDFDLGTPEIDPNGGFVAQRCSAACVPQLGQTCD